MELQNQRLYWIWSDMKGRCTNENHKAYKNYGGRGITVCEKWRSFNDFMSDMSGRPEGGMIDRIDNDKGYSPENCKWSTRKEQNSNRRNCIYVELNGLTVTLKEACRVVGIKYRPVHKRLRRGWDIMKALYTPLMPTNTREVLHA